LYENQISVNVYVAENLERLGLTMEEAARRSNVPEELLDRFLTDLSRLTLAEKLRVAIMFGSVLGDPVQLAMISGVELGNDESSDESGESDQASAEEPKFRRVDGEELKKRGFEFPTDGSRPDFEALKRALADMGIDWDYEA